MDKTIKNLFVGLVVLALIGLGIFFVFFRNSGNSNTAAVQNALSTGKTCPTDVFICPNNEKVTRVLPDCQFAQCPNATNASPAALYK